MAAEIALLLCAALLITVIAAIFSKSMSVTIIMLFYASLVLGIIFTIYQGVVIGLVHITTFAGAMSVMLLTVVLMTGETKLDIGNRTLAALLAAITILVVAASSYSLFTGAPSSPQTATQPATDIFSFIWMFRPWDLLILIIIFAAAMIAVVNLLSSKEARA
jgi:NADH:ubiquinone oxidoreductase subunit 6 (subunit J)